MPYIINENTLAIIPKDNNSKILESKNFIYIEGLPSQIVSENCIYNGSSLDGRQKGSAYLIGSSYKPPIVINDQERIIFIPTHSKRNKNCIWISLNNILNYYEHNNKVVIEFRNYKKVTINISYSLFDKQVLRATRLESSLRGRNNKNSFKNTK